MKKFITQLGIMSIVILIGAYTLDVYFTSVFKGGKTNKVQWISGIHDQKFDIAVLGSSRAWWNIDMNTINEQLAVNSINLASNHFSYSEMLLRIKRLYANNNTIDNLYLQTEYWTLYSDDMEFSSTVYDYLPFLDEEITFNHLKEKSNEWYLYKYVPFWRYSEYNFQWGTEEVLLTKLNLRNTLFDETGSFFSNNQFYGQPIWSPQKPPTTTIHPNFLELIEFCKANSIEVHVFTAPIYHAQTDQNLQFKFEQAIESLDLKYSNYLHLLSDSTSFNDNTHLSIKGGKLMTEKLISDLRDENSKR